MATRTELFVSLSSKTAQMGETKDCAVKALAIAAEVSYEVAHQTLKQLGRKDRSGTPHSMIIDALRKLGKIPVRIDQTVITSRYPGKHAQKTQVTPNQPARFNKAWADGNTYLMFTKGHVLAVVNGVNHDWTVGRSFLATHLYRVN